MFPKDLARKSIYFDMVANLYQERIRNESWDALNGERGERICGDVVEVDRGILLCINLTNDSASKGLEEKK